MVDVVERFMDAVETRSTQNNYANPGEKSYSYITGYLEATLGQLAARYPEVQKYLADSTKYIERDIFSAAIGMEDRMLNNIEQA
jgi:hypothetical protein